MRLALFGLAAFALAACQTIPANTDPLPPPEPTVAASHGAMTPLPSSSIVDGRLFLPPPPVPGSSADRADLAIMQGPWTEARTAQAAQDNEIDAFTAFDGVLGANFTEANLRDTATLLRHVTAAAGAASGPPKDYYAKPRPFIRFPNRATCINPTDALRNSAAYPSGHAAIGFAWALTLAELLPARTDALMARGIDYGQSRVVCGVHWQSDVNAGRVLGAAAFARLQSDDGFQRELAAARAELMAAYPN